ncbi:MAG: hypothetical protein AAF458_21590 [Pseudomonadota bacterium]
MQIPTNTMGLLLAEVDSGGSLRQSGDRVLFGGKRNQSETEWLVRQKVAQYRQTIADIVHHYGGVVARTRADQVLCNLTDGQRAFQAACAIQQSISKRDRSSGRTSPLVTTQMGVRIALHLDRLLVDAGRLSGSGLDTVEALIQAVESDQIIATQSLADSLRPDDAKCVNSMAPMRLLPDDDPVGVSDVVWAEARDLRPAALRDNQADASATPAVPTPAPAPTPAAAAAPAAPAAVNDDDDDDEPVTRIGRLLNANTVDQTGLMERLRNAPAAEEVVSETRMELRYKGKQVVLDASRPTITLRGGPQRIPHARITLNDDGFVLQNLNDAGTLLRNGDGAKSLCQELATLEGQGVISLSETFDAEGQLIEYTVHA